MTYFEFQVEEPSMEAALEGLLPRIVGNRAAWKVINYRNKQRLLRNFPSRLRAYSARLRQEDLKIYVLIDSDDVDCRALKSRLERMALDAGLSTKTRPRTDGIFHVINRIVVCELESWYFGDIQALRMMYPKLAGTLVSKKAYREPDKIRHTWEALLRELKKVSYHRHGFAKIGLAREMGRLMSITNNSARSFRAL
jgi:hypothetical protein